jgi:hypothetical protein
MDLTGFRTMLSVLVLKGWTSYVCIALLLLTLLAIVGLGTQFVVEGRADNLTKTHILDESKRVDCSIAGSKAKDDFINEQRSEISAFGNSHRHSAVKFFTYFYTTYIVFTIFGLIAAISLAIITKTGINKANPHIITVFLVCTSIVVLYQGSLGVFQHKSNIDNNAKLAVNYAVLADQIDTFCTTGKINVRDPNEALNDALPKIAAKTSDSNANAATKPAPPQTETPTVGKIQPFYVEPSGDEFINFVAWQMQHLRSFSIALDDTKVSAIDTKRFLLQ